MQDGGLYRVCVVQLVRCPPSCPSPALLPSTHTLSPPWHVMHTTLPAPRAPQPWLVGRPGQELREQRCITPANGELEPWMFAFTVDK